MRHDFIETRSEPPVDDDNDPVAAATAAVNELRTASEQHRTQLDQRLTTELRGITERLEEIDVRTQRPAGGGEQRNEANELERRAFLNFARHGREALPPEEVRALRVTEDTSGGYLAPEQFVNELLKELIEISPVRQAARVGQATAGTVVIPKRTGRITAYWVGETEQRTETEPAYGQARIEMHEMACYIDVSNWLLEDSAVNLESELASDFAEEFGRLEAVSFVNGTGVKQPKGIMSDPAVPEVANGHATVLAPDALIKLLYALPAFYRNRGAWLLNGSSIAAVRLFKDTAGRYLWQESLIEGQPPTLLGRPVIEAPDMEDIASAAHPIAYGDFSTAYRIYDRVGLSVLRDPYTMATKGLVRFHARRRVGADVVVPEAMRRLKMATSV